MCRRWAAMGADAVDDDARKDEDHAGKPDEMRHLLGTEPLVGVVT